MSWFDRLKRNPWVCLACVVGLAASCCVAVFVDDHAAQAAFFAAGAALWFNNLIEALEK